MLTAIEKLGVEIKYIELGNELYAQDDNYKKVFPTGKDYALRVNEWLPELKKKFPNSKIAALFIRQKELKNLMIECITGINKWLKIQ